ncbi:MAG TPA: PP2C family serine/threonine-protein phosphatase [Gemmataceae bacterium]
MPVRVSCPHCRAPCLVAEQHLGVPVQCGRCARTFTTRADPTAARTPATPAEPPLVHLDIGGATSPGEVRRSNEDSFLVQQLSWCNLDGWHELAALAIANDTGGAAAVLAPLLSKALNGVAQNAAGVPEAIAVALREANAVVMIWDGHVHIGHTGNCRVYHQRAGRLVQIGHQLKLAVGDWLIVACGDLDAAALQAEITKTSSSALHRVQQLVERCGQTVIAVRGY